MRISLIKSNKIQDIILPSMLEGSYWISDTDNNGIRKNLISIEPNENKCRMNSNKDVYCVENNVIVSYFDLQPYHFYTLEQATDKKQFLIYTSEIKEKYNYYNITNLLNNGIYIGNNKDTISYPLLEKKSALLKSENGKIYIIDNNSNCGIFVNKVKINQKKEIKIGDIVFMMGLQFFVFLKTEPTNPGIKNIYLAINNHDKSEALVNNISPVNLNYYNEDFTESEEEFEISQYEENDFFHRIPRYVNHLKPVEVNLDAPPSKYEEPNQSLLLTLGPMVTMSMTSLLTGYAAVSNLMSGETTWQRAMPSLIMCGTMFASIFIWPLFTKRYQKSQREKKEKLRQKKYSAYIEEKRNFIIDTKRKQTEILKNSFPNVKYCEEVILNRYTNLWQKRIEDEDYLKINLGIGDFPAAIEIRYPTEHFSMHEDNLKDLVAKVGSEPRILSGVPIVLSLLENYICGFIGKEDIIGEYVRRLLIQILAFHSYEDLKIIVLTDEEKEYHWKFLKDTYHCFTDDKTLRFFATNNNEYKEVCYYLGRIFNSRKEQFNKSNTSIADMNKIYLIITDSFKKIKDYDIIDDILENKKNLGFSIMILDDKMIDLPEQCKTFVDVQQEVGALHTVDNFVEGIKFKPDFADDIDFEKCTKILANIPIEIDSDDEGQLPNKIGFLEMYDVGKVEQLNSLSRWKNNNPMMNLQAPIGIGKSAEIIGIDLHEKYHGPHGLIAGMTGSGKSEFIITYILSMAINYHPYEVQFILIDYKGGGLAGAFENQTIGLKLPHLVGTITNLDVNEINRSLASIESELKRRQALFNVARENSGESTIDIYKYQKMYRDKLVDEPVSHLFIISDEFAELKVQQPEFMAQLISTARIGRSLGVHLILATQKPSGVVDPQIWSNSRFRVCMRVQETSDSNEVIKCPDAAYLKQTGRFYFQVGYNEIFVLGQAAWAGGKYFPEEKVKKTIDTSIKVINNIGYVMKTLETKPKRAVVQTQGEELLNIVKYLDSIAKDLNINCRPLWLEKIPEDIRVENLAQKYAFQKQNFIVNPIIGEYDVPSSQKQCLLTLPISEEGNCIIFGAPGSGKENFLTTLIYSSSLYYSPEELNFYIIDFGSGILKNFKNYPLVGDIIASDENEKLVNLFKLLNQEIEIRKELFADFNGDYYQFCQSSGKSVPTIIVAINNYESYQEFFEQYDDLLITLTREGSKYGIYFVLMVNTPNGLRFKLRQNFPIIHSLQQNNDDDYISILGNVHKKYPARIFGRGIMKENDEVYEFQIATICEKENIANYIKEKSIEFSQRYKSKAIRIPVLPKTIVYEELKANVEESEQLIIGMDKNTLEVVTYDFKKNFCTMITSFDINQTQLLVNPLILQIINRNDHRLIVINAEEYFVDLKNRDSYEYIDSNFDNIISELYEIIEKQKEQYKENDYSKDIFKNNVDIYCVIIGLDTLIKRLSSEVKNKFSSLFEGAKNLGTISYFIVDSIDKIKKFEYENWYKESVEANNGIWLGNGIEEQFSLKISKRIDEMKKEIPNNFCFVVKKGRPRIVKFIEKVELENEVESFSKKELIEQIDIL